MVETLSGISPLSRITVHRDLLCALHHYEHMMCCRVIRLVGVPSRHPPTFDVSTSRCARAQPEKHRCPRVVRMATSWGPRHQGVLDNPRPGGIARTSGGAFPAARPWTTGPVGLGEEQNILLRGPYTARRSATATAPRDSAAFERAAAGPAA